MSNPPSVTPSDNNTLPAYDSILIDIAHYVYHYQIKNLDAINTAHLALLDALGCAVETIQSKQCDAMIGPFVPGCSVSNGFRLPGTAYELDPVKGACDMGVLIRYLDHSDGLTGAEWGHPSGQLIGNPNMSTSTKSNNTTQTTSEPS